MNSDSDILLKLHEEEWALIRHYEEQRAVVTNFVLIVASAAVGFFVQKGVIFDSLPVAILLIVLGLYGAITVTKLYERTQYASRLAKHYANRLDELYPTVGIGRLRDEARAEHKVKFPVASRLHMNHLWFALHMAVALVGVGLTIAILI